MKQTHKLFSAIATSVLLLSACATGAAPAPTAVPPTAAPQPTAAPAMVKTDVMTKTEVMADKAMTDTMAKTGVMTKTEVMADKAMTDTMAKTDVMTKTEVMTKEAMAGDAMAMPAWQTLELTDVATGKAFKLADYHGKTVFVELMATWCPNCKKQLGFVTAAKKQLAKANIVYVALSVESDLDPAKLAQYSQDTKYDLQFAVLNADGLKAFSDAFGRTALNPPSTPHFIIKPDGSNTKLATGFETADKLVAALKAIK